MKKRVYVAGPYTRGDVAINVRTALESADCLLSLGYAPFVPHLTHLWHLTFPHPYQVWIDLDLEWVAICDAVLRIPGESGGADGETAYAIERGIPVYGSIRELVTACPA